MSTGSQDAGCRRPSSVSPLSEVRQLLAQIQAEEEATWRGLHSYAVISRHDFISTRMEHMGAYYDRMTELVGESTMMELITAAQAAVQATGGRTHA
jgi:hypothetical protein